MFLGLGDREGTTAAASQKTSLSRLQFYKDEEKEKIILQFDNQDKDNDRGKAKVRLVTWTNKGIIHVMGKINRLQLQGEDDPKLSVLPVFVID